MSRWRVSRDRNHFDIAGHYLRMGAIDVWDTSAAGGGGPDLVVLYNLKPLIIGLTEVKWPGNTLEDSQHRFQAKGWPVDVCESAEDVAAVVGRWDKRLKRKR